MCGRIRGRNTSYRCYENDFTKCGIRFGRTVVARIGVRRIIRSHKACDRWANVLSTARKRVSCHWEERACFEIPSGDTGLSHEPNRWSTAPDSRIISSSPAIANYTMGVQPAALQVVLRGHRSHLSCMLWKLHKNLGTLFFHLSRFLHVWPATKCLDFPAFYSTLCLNIHQLSRIVQQWELN